MTLACEAFDSFAVYCCRDPWKLKRRRPSRENSSARFPSCGPLRGRSRLPAPPDRILRLDRNRPPVATAAAEGAGEYKHALMIRRSNCMGTPVEKTVSRDSSLGRPPLPVPHAADRLREIVIRRNYIALIPRWIDIRSVWRLCRWAPIQRPS